MNKKTAIDKEFQLSSWAIKNKTTIYVLMFLILYFGISAGQVGEDCGYDIQPS